jgi:pseudouridine synthase
VQLNGRTITELGTRARRADRVTVDGKPLPIRAEPVHVIVHKPAGVVTTLRDPDGRVTIRTLLPRDLPRVFPVGRLDVRSTGLVLLTNDGELAEALMHPRHHVARVYRVKVGGTPDARALARLQRGIRLDDGASAPAEVAIERSLPTKTWLRITVHEGRHHLVRRLCEAIGHRAEKLQRVAIGPLQLGKLPPGAARMLATSEIRALRHAVASAHRQPPSGTLAARRVTTAAPPVARRRRRSAR